MNVCQKLRFENKRRTETYHDRSPFPVINCIVRVHISGKEDFIVLEVVTKVGGRVTTICVDPLGFNETSDTEHAAGRWRITDG